MCNKNLLILGLVAISGAIFSLIAIIATAGVLSAGIFSAPAATPLIVSATVVAGVALSGLIAFRVALDAYYNCVLSKLSIAPTAHCLYEFELARNWLTAAIAAVILFLASCVALVAVSWIPLVVTIASAALIATLLIANGAIIQADIDTAKFIGCIDKQLATQRLPLKVVVTEVWSCPLNKATCANTDLGQVQPSTQGVYSTSPSLAVNAVPKYQQIVTGMTASVTDGFNNKISIDSANLFSPNSHSIGDPNGWVARLDWAALGPKGLRVEPAQRRWTISLDFRLADGSAKQHAIACYISN